MKERVERGKVEMKERGTPLSPAEEHDSIQVITTDTKPSTLKLKVLSSFIHSPAFICNLAIMCVSPSIVMNYLISMTVLYTGGL